MFAQVIEGRTADPAGLRAALDRWTQVLHFTSEAEAREGERREPPPEFQVAMEDMGKLSVGETTFLDLRRPLLRSAH
jgi:hypothetical protein